MKLDFGMNGLIIKEEKVLAVHKVKSQDNFLKLPGGTMEFGEIIEETRIREI